MKPYELDINAEALRVRKANDKWWRDLETGEPIERDKQDMLFLVITELSECFEGWRKNLPDTHLPQYPMMQVEIIDAFIRLLDYTHGWYGDIPYAWTGFEREPTEDEKQVRTVANFLLDLSNAITAFWQKEALLKVTDIHGYEEDVRLSMGDDLLNIIGGLFIFAKFFGFEDQFVEIYEAKMAYNATREDHTLEARRGKHGKKV